jgi:glyoxylase-like metal-dependent hydrolase (beta-lactamase superfamily II)
MKPWLIVTIAAIIIVFILFMTAKRVMKIGLLKTSNFPLPEVSSSDWEQVLNPKVNIQVETLLAGEVPGTIGGLINLKNEKAMGLAGETPLTAPLMAHLVHHPQFGYFLIDTGFDSSYADHSWGHFEGIGKKRMKYHVAKGHGIDEILSQRNITLKAVFCTHFHEHQGGAPSLPDIPFIFGQGEREMDFFPLLYARFLANKTKLQTMNFQDVSEMPIVGKAVDIFGDGSFWAIATPGHTPGHVSYLINGKEGQYLIMGDVCMCRKGYELGVESGGMYADNLEENKASFNKLKQFIETYPTIKPIFGHESDQFKIDYQ